MNEVIEYADQHCLAIGGVGGSGTRALASVLQYLGCEIGSDLNDSLDDLAFTALMKDALLWPPESHTLGIAQRLNTYLHLRCEADDARRGSAVEAFRLSLPPVNDDLPWQTPHFQEERHWAAAQREPDTSALVIWKEPNTHVLLPALMTHFPNLRYLHVVRDGRDMAWSPNQNQLRLWGEQFLGRAVDPRSSQDSFDFWCAVHERLLTLMTRWPGRIEWLSLERAHDNPQDAARLLGAALSFSELGITPLDLQQAIEARIETPASQGRYQNHPALVINSRQETLLAHFGYAG